MYSFFYILVFFHMTKKILKLTFILFVWFYFLLDFILFVCIFFALLLLLRRINYRWEIHKMENKIRQIWFNCIFFLINKYKIILNNVSVFSSFHLIACRERKASTCIHLIYKAIHWAIKNYFGHIMVCVSGPPHDPTLALVKATV